MNTNTQPFGKRLGQKTTFSEKVEPKITSKLYIKSYKKHKTHTKKHIKSYKII